MSCTYLTISAGSNAAPHHSCLNHLAFDCADLAATRASLDAAGIAYETDVVDELHQVQLFLTDPTGIGVELAFTDSQYRAR